MHTQYIYIYLFKSILSFFWLKPCKGMGLTPFPDMENLGSVLKDTVTPAVLRYTIRQYHMALTIPIPHGPTWHSVRWANKCAFLAFDRSCYVSVIYIQKSLHEYKVLLWRGSWSLEVFKTSKDSDLYLATLFLILKAEVNTCIGVLYTVVTIRN